MQALPEYGAHPERALHRWRRGGLGSIVRPGAGGGDKPYHLTALFFFSLPLLAEVFRKYLFPWNGVLALGDALAAVIAAAIFALSPSRWSAYIAAAVGVLSAWGLVTVLFGHQDGMLAIVGLRAILVPACYLVGAVQLARRLGGSATGRILHRVAGFWLTVIGTVAVLQLVEGPEHWLNDLPAGLGGDERKGIGDYTFAEFGLPGLFRPTSIFLHTGKFGAVSFVLAAYRLFYSTAERQRGIRWMAQRLLDLAVLLVSGQRAALAGYVLVYGALLLTEVKMGSLALRAALLGVLVLVALSAFAALDSEAGIPQLVAARAVSTFMDIPERFRSNVIEPGEYVVDQSGLTGAGLGAFSLGSGLWGGVPLYEVVPVGGAENSWLRIIAEQGMIGLVLQALFLVWLVSVSWAAWRAGTESRRVRGAPSHELGVLVLCPGMVLAVLLLWANTHDVLGNVTVMSLSFGLFGLAFGGMRKVRVDGSAALPGGPRRW